jgi:acyl-CoA thioester hydrolase
MGSLLAIHLTWLLNALALLPSFSLMEQDLLCILAANGCRRSAKFMGQIESIITLRVRYSETDQMGTFYNSRALEWFECGRSELMRDAGAPYTTLEAAGVYLPVVVAHVEYLGRARYDDALEMTTIGRFEGRARLRCEVRIAHADNGAPVVQGYTIHAFINKLGKPVKPPAWFAAIFQKESDLSPAPAKPATRPIYNPKD